MFILHWLDLEKWRWSIDGSMIQYPGIPGAGWTLGTSRSTAIHHHSSGTTITITSAVNKRVSWVNGIPAKKEKELFFMIQERIFHDHKWCSYIVYDVYYTAYIIRCTTYVVRVPLRTLSRTYVLHSTPYTWRTCFILYYITIYYTYCSATYDVQYVVY